MATGPDHYGDAEAFLKRAAEPGVEFGSATERYFLAAAQVHATLALAAVERESLDLNLRIYRSHFPIAEAAEPAPTCTEACCFPGEPGAHTCTRIVGHPGVHLSAHTTWPES
jgi:hypothetical protein